MWVLASLVEESRSGVFLVVRNRRLVGLFLPAGDHHTAPVPVYSVVLRRHDEHPGVKNRDHDPTHGRLACRVPCTYLHVPCLGGFDSRSRRLHPLLRVDGFEGQATASVCDRGLCVGHDDHLDHP